MTSLSDVSVKRKISCQQYINVWLSMMSGHGTNPIFLNKKIKIWPPEHLLPFPPSPRPAPRLLRPIAFQFCYTPNASQSGRHMCITAYGNILARYTDVFGRLLHSSYFRGVFLDKNVGQIETSENSSKAICKQTTKSKPEIVYNLSSCLIWFSNLV